MSIHPACTGNLVKVTYSNKPELHPFFLSFFAAFFSFGVKTAFFLLSFLLFCPLLMVLTPEWWLEIFQTKHCRPIQLSNDELTRLKMYWKSKKRSVLWEHGIFCYPAIEIRSRMNREDVDHNTMNITSRYCLFELRTICKSRRYSSFPRRMRGSRRYLTPLQIKSNKEIKPAQQYFLIFSPTAIDPYFFSFPLASLHPSWCF